MSLQNGVKCHKDAFASFFTKSYIATSHYLRASLLDYIT